MSIVLRIVCLMSLRGRASCVFSWRSWRRSMRMMWLVCVRRNRTVRVRGLAWSQTAMKPQPVKWRLIANIKTCYPAQSIRWILTSWLWGRTLCIVPGLSLAILRICHHMRLSGMYSSIFSSKAICLQKSVFVIATRSSIVQWRITMWFCFRTEKWSFRDPRDYIVGWCGFNNDVKTWDIHRTHNA